MSERLKASMDGILDRLMERARHDPDLRACLKGMAEALLEALDAESQRIEGQGEVEDQTAMETGLVQGGVSPDSGLGDGEVVSAADRSTEEATEEESSVEDDPVDLSRLTLGKGARTETSHDGAFRSSAWRGPVQDDDLPGIASRCRLKARALRWSMKRQRLLKEGVDFALEIRPRDEEIVHQGKEQGCFLWMSRPEFDVLRSPMDLENAARAFEVTAEATELVQRIQVGAGHRGAEYKAALALLAEAQSALRVAVKAVSRQDDQEQIDIFSWLKLVTSSHKIYIDRYMRIEDPADPSDLEKLRSRIASKGEVVQAKTFKDRKAAESIKRLSYHAKRLGEDAAGEQLEKLIEVIEVIIGEGISPSRIEIREIILPIHEKILEMISDREALPHGLRAVLQEVDEYLAAHASEGEVEEGRGYSEEVKRVAALLEGRRVVLVGGLRRPVAAHALESAFRLEELVWISTREHQSIEDFRSQVTRSGTAVVLLAIRWASHAFGELREICREAGIPFVRLAAGYGCNQVAHQILEQVGLQLGEQHEAGGL